MGFIIVYVFCWNDVDAREYKETKVEVFNKPDEDITVQHVSKYSARLSVGYVIFGYTEMMVMRRERQRNNICWVSLKKNHKDILQATNHRQLGIELYVINI